MYYAIKTVDVPLISLKFRCILRVIWSWLACNEMLNKSEQHVEDAEYSPGWYSADKRNGGVLLGEKTVFCRWRWMQNKVRGRKRNDWMKRWKLKVKSRKKNIGRFPNGDERLILYPLMDRYKNLWLVGKNSGMNSVRDDRKKTDNEDKMKRSFWVGILFLIN